MEASSTGGAVGAERLARGLLLVHPEEAARVLDRHPVEEVTAFLAASAGHAAPALERLTTETGASVLETLDGPALARILPEVDPARAAAFLARLDDETRRERLSHVDPAIARELESLVAYPPESAGSLMDPKVTTSHADATVEQTLGRIRARPGNVVDAVFLIDTDARLEGVVPIADLARAQPETRLGALARGVLVVVGAMDGREEVVERLARIRLPVLPVVDVEGRLLGVIRHDALVKAVEEEATVDVQTMVGASREERALSKVGFAVRKRLPWLEINLVTAFLAASVVGLFESTIAKYTALAVLLPVVAGQSGNSGAQALAVTMRGLALREVRLRHWLVVAWKEVRVGLLNGIAVALTTAVGVYVWSRSGGLSAVIGVSMVLSMVAAGLSGAVIPMMLTALRQDPAQASSIVLTTVTDVVGFFSFLGIATLLAAYL